MKLHIMITVLILSFPALYGCDANCKGCHPVLQGKVGQDKDHKILEKCTSCHVKKEGEEDHSECGKDCFACHDSDKVYKSGIHEHQEIQKCIVCHASIDTKLFDADGSGSQNDFLQSKLGL